MLASPGGAPRRRLGARGYRIARNPPLAVQAGYSGLCGGKFSACRPDELQLEQTGPARNGLIDEWHVDVGKSQSKNEMCKKASLA